MRVVISEKGDVRDTIKLFRGRLEELSHKSENLNWVFPNGESARCETYFLPTRHGKLLAAVPGKWGDRQPHLFALGGSENSPSPDVEINIPDSVNKRVSGVYVRDDRQVVLCRRVNGFTAYRGRMPGEFSEKFFRNWLIEADEGGRETSLISVGAIGSETLGDDIASFVTAVKEMKSEFKSLEPSQRLDGQQTANTREYAWRDGEEFEGQKSFTSSNERSSYEYQHGPLCNTLRLRLKAFGDRNGLLAVSNRNVDLALVDKISDRASAIFEVKTSASLGGQLYSAMGQLMYYKHRYGGVSTRLFLVLPLAAKPTMTSSDFFSAHGITLLYGAEGHFETASGADMEEALVAL